MNEIERAINILEDGFWWIYLDYMPEGEANDELHNALDTAITALREKEARERKPQTNANKIQSITDEELAEWLAKIIKCHKEFFINWLQQPVEGE